MKILNVFLVILVSAIFMSGCSNYRLAGTPTDLPFSSVYVKPVRNDSYAPQATNLLTNAISNAINQTPQLKTAYEGDAQATLSTTLIDYRRVPIATRADDTALAASYAMEAVAVCTLTRSNGDVVFKNRKVKARAMLYMGGNNDVIGNEYQNMPVLMRELGGKIKDAVIGIW
ncbi:MAG: hypothetical protein E7036_07460 [Opitutales bacterium]|nr:hypothetical protein [Opitutales bacterium]MBQ2721496.1 hypothetical protein [Opitutales bacterium]